MFHKTRLFSNKNQGLFTKNANPFLACVCVCGVLKYCLYNFLKRPSVLEHERSARAVGTNIDLGTSLHQIQAVKLTLFRGAVTNLWRKH